MKFSVVSLVFASISALLPAALPAQTAPAPGTTRWNPWDTQHSNTKEALRGIHAVGNGVAWASGAHGTVLRTEDSGYVWQQCKVPDGAGNLDFRSVWAWDAKTALVMSSGTGRESRLYKTTDGCLNWKLLYTNHESSGFWDGLVFADGKNGYLLGDPVKKNFVLLRTADGGEHWTSVRTRDLNVGETQIGAFAASNSALALGSSGADKLPMPWFGTSGVSGGAGPFVYAGSVNCPEQISHKDPAACLSREWRFARAGVPIAGGTQSAGVFSLGIREDAQGAMHAVAVGGDYTHPLVNTRTAAYLDTKSGSWYAATHLPHGYRSAVAWDTTDNVWIAVGPNGSDLSYDDGKTWSALGDDGYNAISFPWAVGPEGRIGKFIAIKGK